MSRIRATWEILKLAPRAVVERRGPIASVGVLIMALAPIGVFLWTAHERRWMNEDGFINLRVVRNLLDGNGLVFNLGERVEAGTSPLWLFWIAVVGAFGVRLEHVAVYSGLAFAAAGLFFAEAAAFLAIKEADSAWAALRRRFVLPIGAGVFAVLPPAWDYASSGLEIGMLLGWTGLCFFLLVRLALRDLRDEPTPLRSWCINAAVLGLGPLVRPEMTLFSFGFLAVLALGLWRDVSRRPHPAGADDAGTGVRSRPPQIRSGFAGRATSGERLGRLRAFVLVAACAGAIPVGYQVFRMGYFAALTPNTGMAKEAFRAHWGQGWRYAVNFFGLYYLLLPLVVMFMFWLQACCRAWSSRSRMLAACVLAPMVAAVLHGLYVIRLGGDFMHGRMFLPSVFGFLLPVSVVPLFGRESAREATAQRVFGVLVLLVWMVICGRYYRVDPENQWGIGDERGWYVRNSQMRHPVAVEDYARFGFYHDGERLRDAAIAACPGGTLPRAGEAGACGRVLLMDQPEHGRFYPGRARYPLARAVDPEVAVVAARVAIGMAGYRAGSAVSIVDRSGLADPIAARLELRARGRPGHEKALSNAWVAARYTDPAPGEDAQIAAARHALECGALGDLRQAVTGPITFGVFLRNLADAWRFQTLRIPADPFEAESRFCGTAPLYRAFEGGKGGGPVSWLCPAPYALWRISGTVLPERQAIADATLQCRRLVNAGGGVRFEGTPLGGPTFGQPLTERYSLECPEGKVPIGMFGGTGVFVQQMGFVCGTIERSRGGGIEIGSVARSAPVGPGGGRPYALACPPGQAVAGFEGRTGALIDAAGIICRPILGLSASPMSNR